MTVLVDSKPMKAVWGAEPNAAAGVEIKGRHAQRQWIWPVAIAACFYIGAHLATLTRFPMPMFDDTFFASLTESYSKTGELKLLVSPLWLDKPVYLYGPIYFLLGSYVIHQFAFGIFQSRILGLLFGIAIVPVVYASLRSSGVRTSFALFACLLLALDPQFNYSIHSGRMDSIALFFILASFHLVQRSSPREAARGSLLCALSGTLAAIGILTTPRPGYLLAPIALLLTSRVLMRRDGASLAQLVAWILPIALLYSAWIVVAFGGVAEMFAYYASFASTYVGGRFNVQRIHYPLLVGLFVPTALTAICQPRVLRNALPFFSLLGVFAFYALGVNPTQFGHVYSILTLPLAYMGLGYCVSGNGVVSTRPIRIRQSEYGLLTLVLVFNIVGTGTQTVITLMQWQTRAPQIADVAVRTHIPSGSKVIGDDRFYFAVRKAGSDFQYLERGKALPERVAYHRDVYDFDYMITDSKEEAGSYLIQVPMKKIATIEVPPTNRLAERFANLVRYFGLRHSLDSSYEGSIFVRVR